MRFPRRRREELPPPDHRSPATVERIAREHGVDAATAERWFREMLAFLDVAGRTGEPLAPPKPVAAAWRAFAADRAEYEAYCRERFGRVIDS